VRQARLGGLEEAPVALEVLAQRPALGPEVGHLDRPRAQQVGPEDHPVGVGDDDVAHLGHVAGAHVGDRRRRVDVVVGVGREHAAHVGPGHERAEVQPDEARARMAGNDDLELLVQARERREAAAPVPPVGVLAQLLDPRVGLGQRREEGRRVAGVDGHRQPELAGHRPQAREARVADGDPAPAGVAQPQAEVLPDLDPDRAVPGGRAQVALERVLEAGRADRGEVRNVAAQQGRLEVSPLLGLDVGRGRRVAAVPEMDRCRQPADAVDVAYPVSRRVVVMAMGVDDLAAIPRVLADHFDSAAAFCR
jgi:hypothetical protein